MRQGKVRKYITSGINSRLNGSKEREGLADHGLYCSSGSVSFLSCSLSGPPPTGKKKVKCQADSCGYTHIFPFHSRSCKNAESAGWQKERKGKEGLCYLLNDNLHQKLPCKLRSKTNKQGQIEMGAAERPGGHMPDHAIKETGWTLVRLHHHELLLITEATSELRGSS